MASDSTPPTAEQGNGIKGNVAASLEQARQKANLTRAELARRLGTSRARVTQTLTGTENLTIKTLERYAAVLNLRVSISLEENL